MIAAKELLFGSDTHWVLIRIDRNKLKKHLKDEPYEVDMIYHKLQKYNVLKMCKDICDQIPEEEWILMKAEFEGEAEFRALKRNEQSN